MHVGEIVLRRDDGAGRYVTATAAPVDVSNAAAAARGIVNL